MQLVISQIILTLDAALDLLVCENSDKNFFVSMTLWIVHQANVSPCLHELSWGTDLQCGIVNPTGIFHFACRFEDLEKITNIGNKLSLLLALKLATLILAFQSLL